MPLTNERRKEKKNNKRTNRYKNKLLRFQSSNKKWNMWKIVPTVMLISWPIITVEHICWIIYYSILIDLKNVISHIVTALTYVVCAMSIVVGIALTDFLVNWFVECRILIQYYIIFETGSNIQKFINNIMARIEASFLKILRWGYHGCLQFESIF